MNAVNPPKRSVSISRSPERFSESNGRPSLSFRGGDIFLQNRSIPNMKSSATVMMTEISREPKQPRRFEKKKNMLGTRRSDAR